MRQGPLGIYQNKFGSQPIYDDKSEEKQPMTFSIVARDPVTGAFGVATATAGPAVGALVPHGETNVGVVATQAMTNPYLALDCLINLRTMTAREAMDAALANDLEPQRRQLILVDRLGEAAAWTGKSCEPFAGHQTAHGVAVAGNIIGGAEVLEAMLGAYAREAPFEQRLLGALRAGENAGGDRRGIGSAALKVYVGEPIPTIDLRIDLSDAPLEALAVLLHRTTTGSYAEFFSAIPKRQQ
jgi:uncharacterized Ntn-hydrolase superfamily protein